MFYLIDTNIIVHYVRQSETFKDVRAKLDASDNEVNLVLSEVSIGEIYSLTKRNKWGTKKMQRLHSFLSVLTVFSISYPGVYEAYADIDAYSQNKHPTLSLPQAMTARNMGKNDVWIAATAYVLRATLVTTDKDFDHLQHFFGLEWVEQ